MEFKTKTEYKADSIFTNHIFNFGMQILNIVFPLIAIPYTTRLFGPKILGNINYANSIVSYFILIATLGLPVYAVREIAKSRDNNTELRNKLKQIFILQLLFTLFSIGIFLIIVFNIESIYLDRYIYLLLGIQIISNGFNLTWFIQGIEKYRYMAFATFISKFINIVLIFTMLKSRQDYNMYAFIIGITYFINMFMSLIISLLLLKNFKSEEKICINIRDLKTHIYPLLIFFLSDVSIKVYTAMDQTMLGILSTDESVGYYSMSVKLVKTILVFITSITIVMLPRISSSVKNNNIEDVKKYVGMCIKLVFILAIPAIFGILAIGDEIVVIYLGEEFINSIGVFKLVSINLLIIGLSSIFGSLVLIPFGKEKKYTIILSLSALINFILNLIMIPKLSYYGATYSTIIAELVVAILMYIEVKKILGEVPCIFDYGKYLVPSVIFFIVIVFIIKPIVNSQTLTILVSIAVAGLIYGILLIILKEDMMMYGIYKIKNLLKGNQ